jgi:hypothetical protein
MNDPNRMGVKNDDSPILFGQILFDQSSQFLDLIFTAIRQDGKHFASFWRGMADGYGVSNAQIQKQILHLWLWLVDVESVQIEAPASIEIHSKATPQKLIRQLKTNKKNRLTTVFFNGNMSNGPESPRF